MTLKRFTALTCLLLTAVLAGCTSDDAKTSRAATTSPSATKSAVPAAQWGQPFDTPHFTITLSQPVDATAKFSCAKDNGSTGNCGRISTMDITVTTKADAIALANVIKFSGQDDNYSELAVTWNSMVGEAVLPQGKTHKQTGVQIHFSEESKSDSLILWLLDLDGSKIAEWRQGQI